MGAPPRRRDRARAWASSRRRSRCGRGASRTRCSCCALPGGWSARDGRSSPSERSRSAIGRPAWWLITAARLAHYRSFRDHHSQRRDAGGWAWTPSGDEVYRGPGVRVCRLQLRCLDRRSPGPSGSVSWHGTAVPTTATGPTRSMPRTWPTITGFVRWLVDPRATCPVVHRRRGRPRRRARDHRRSCEHTDPTSTPQASSASRRARWTT